MLDEAKEQVDDVEEAEQAEVDEIEEQEEASTENEEPEQASEEEEAEEVVLSFNGEEPEEKEDEPAPAWVRDLRKAHRTTQKENKELKRKLEELAAPKQPKVSELRKKPTLEEFDYDSDEFEASLESWFEEKRQHEDAKRQEEEAKKSAESSWQEKLNAYENSKTQLRVKDYSEAEEEVLDALSQTQQGIIVQGADNPALVVYALGKNPEKIKALASENDPVRFAVAIGKLEKDLKMVKKTKKAPDPERRVTGSSSGGNADSTLEKLRAEAEKTGNYSKVTAYKRSKQK